MSSLSTSGRASRKYWRLDVVLPVGRRTIRIGPVSVVSRAMAQAVQTHIDQLVGCLALQIEPPAELLHWASSTSLADRFRELELIPAPEQMPSVTVGDILDEWFTSVTADVSHGTEQTYLRSVRKIRATFGNRAPGDITEDDVKRFAADMELSKATVRLHCRHLRRFLGWCQERGIVSVNVGRAVPTTVTSNLENRAEVSRDTIDALLPTLTQEWRAFVALGRFGGLRLPSEIRNLRWGDVLWDQSRFIVRARKTESRQVPLFPELRAELEPLTPTDDVYVLPRIRHMAGAGSLLRRQVIAAGIKPWPRLCHNMRATRESELLHEYPVHVVCQWLGNSPAVALTHYASASRADFDRAAGVSGKSQENSPNRT